MTKAIKRNPSCDVWPPNSTGLLTGLRTVFPYSNASEYVGSGVFSASPYDEDVESQNVNSGDAFGVNAYTIELDLSKQFSIYDGAVMQPSAISVLPCIRC